MSVRLSDENTSCGMTVLNAVKQRKKIVAKLVRELVKKGAIVPVILVLLVTSVSASTVRFQWTSNKDHVLGYRLYYGLTQDVCGGTYVDVPVDTLLERTYPTYSLFDLGVGKWYFMLTGYNDVGESECTKAISYTFDPNGFNGWFTIITTGK